MNDYHIWELQKRTMHKTKISHYYFVIQDNLTGKVSTIQVTRNRYDSEIKKGVLLK